MKYTIYILIFICFLVNKPNLYAQKNIEKNINLSSSQSLELNLKYATNIEVKNSEGNKVRIVASVNIDDNKNNEQFTLEVSEEQDKVIVNSDILDIDKILKKKTLIAPKPTNYYNHYTKDEKHLIVKDSYLETLIEYQVFIPKNVKFSLKTISGDIQYEYAKQEAGLKSISGNITLLASENANLDLKLKTITGDVYTNLSLQFPDNEKEGNLNRIGGGSNGESAKAKLNKGGKLLTLKSVSGNIFLKKK